jgi:hypothetical protein
MADHPLDVDVEPVLPEHLGGSLCENPVCMLTTYHRGDCVSLDDISNSGRRHSTAC